jgi:hypothetical protein
VRGKLFNIVIFTYVFRRDPKILKYDTLRFWLPETVGPVELSLMNFHAVVDWPHVNCCSLSAEGVHIDLGVKDLPP